jgi:hypothetical protein
MFAGSADQRRRNNGQQGCHKRKKRLGARRMFDARWEAAFGMRGRFNLLAELPMLRVVRVGVNRQRQLIGLQ